MIKKVSITFGILFLLIGIAGFFNNPVIGAQGIFLSNTALNIIHLLSGALLLFVSLKTRSYVLTLKFMGLLYILIALVGLVVTIDSESGMIFSIIAVNGLDNWLHLLFGILMFLLSMSE